MPMYEYKCNSCGEIFEELVPVSKRDASERCCPKCGSKDVKRNISHVAPAQVDGGKSTESSTCPTCSDGTCSVCGL